MLLLQALDLVLVEIQIDQLLKDIRRGNLDDEDSALAHLACIAQAPDLRGTDAARRAAEEYQKFMEQPLVTGVFLNGKPITRQNIPTR